MPKEEKFCVNCGAKIPADAEICPVCGARQASSDTRPKINIRGISVGFLVARLIASGMLILALSRHPYSYYTLLRWIVCGTAAYGAFKSVELEKTIWVWVLGIIALFFNPIIPVHLSRETWAPINVITALIFIVSIFTIRGNDDKTQS